MAQSILRYILLFFICVLSQVLIFNNIALFGVAIPIVFIYFLVRLPINIGLPYLFTFAFLLGLIVDIFSDTPGVNALSCTLLVAIRKPVFYAYMEKDDNTQRLTPGVSTMGLIEYSKYLFSLTFIYCFLAFTIEYFTFADVKSIVILTAASAALTFVILLSIDCLIPVKFPAINNK